MESCAPARVAVPANWSARVNICQGWTGDGSGDLTDSDERLLRFSFWTAIDHVWVRVSVVARGSIIPEALVAIRSHLGLFVFGQFQCSPEVRIPRNAKIRHFIGLMDIGVVAARSVRVEEIPR